MGQPLCFDGNSKFRVIHILLAKISSEIKISIAPCKFIHNCAS